MKCKLMIIVIVVLISMSSCQNQPKEGFNEFTVNGEKRYLLKKKKRCRK